MLGQQEGAGGATCARVGGSNACPCQGKEHRAKGSLGQGGPEPTGQGQSPPAPLKHPIMWPLMPPTLRPCWPPPLLPLTPMPPSQADL